MALHYSIREDHPCYVLSVRTISPANRLFSRDKWSMHFCGHTEKPLDATVFDRRDPHEDAVSNTSDNPRQRDHPGRSRRLVLPHQPGPLIPLHSTKLRRAPDDLDHLIDDVFGPDDDESASWFDLGLIGVGAALLAWATVGNGPQLVLLGAVATLALGCILPIRTAWRAAKQKRAQTRQVQALGAGVPLLLDDPAVAALAEAYDHLLQVLPKAPVGLQRELLHAAHGAAMEGASLLRGGTPGSDTERGYLVQRTKAIEALTGAVRAGGERADDGQGPTVSPAHLVQARDELDELSGTGSLQRLDRLIADLRDGDGREQ